MTPEIRIEPTNTQTHADHYSKLYGPMREKSDSPEKSRVALMRKLRQAIDMLNPEEKVLNLGSGPQLLERQYIAAYGKPSTRMITVDIADIPQARLLAQRSCVDHVRADGTSLPFADESFPIVISNMALDFMPSRAIEEVARVLKPGGKAFINLHHANLIPKDIEQIVESGRNPNSGRKLSPNKMKVYRFWLGLLKNNTLYTDKQNIKDAFEKHSLIVEKASEITDGQDTWWEVDLVKKSQYDILAQVAQFVDSEITPEYDPVEEAEKVAGRQDAWQNFVDNMNA